VKQINSNPVILFDGVCNLCNGAVQFILRRDRTSTFRFASLQSAYATSLLARLHVDPAKEDTIFVYEDGRLFARSEAILRIASHLEGFSWMKIFRIIPSFIRDGVYRLVARKRYAMFGKRESCMIPTPELRERFLE
jgi:predicted DCC family thiol-disulfide oxidoreductase YuxK